MHIRRLVNFEFHPAGLHFFHRFGGVFRDRTGFRIGHQAPRSEYFAQFANFHHRFGRGHGDVEIVPARIALGDHVFETDMFGTGGAGGISGLATGKNKHAHQFATAVRQRNRAANHLVGLLRVNPEAERQVNGFVEFGFREFGEYANGFLQGIRFLGVNHFKSLFITFAGHLFGCGTDEPGGSPAVVCCNYD